MMAKFAVHCEPLALTPCGCNHCQCYVRAATGEWVPCDKPGKPRSGYGLTAGRYCDDCWGRMLLEVRR